MAVRFDDQRLGTGYRRRNFTMEKKKKKINETLLSLSLSTHTGAESFPIMVEAEMRTNVPPPRFRLSATSASTTLRIPKYRSRNKLTGYLFRGSPIP